MGMDKLTQEGIIGEFFDVLNSGSGAFWVPLISNYFESTQGTENYPWLGMVPQLREWVGGRDAKGLLENNIEVKNKHFEATVDILLEWLRRDKTGQAYMRIAELAQRANTHFASLLSTLIVNGESGLCYDGLYYFDTTHNEGNSGDQSNLISVDISGLPVATAGTITVPSVAEMQFVIAKGIEALVGFLDNEGEPVNEGAQHFLVMCPVVLMTQCMNAVATPVQVAETQTALVGMKQNNFRIDVAPNPRLSSWTSSVAVFAADARAKALIRQEETLPELKIKGEGSDYEFDNDAHQYGIDTWRNVAYGDWKKACKVTMI